MQHLLLYISTYNLIRYEQFFDIIEFMCKFVFELQLRFLLIYFKD